MTQHEVIDPFEERAVPMEHQKEHGCAEVGLRVPLSLGTVREDFDKKGEPAQVYDVVWNPATIKRCFTDASFRNSCVELVFNYILQKHQHDLSMRFSVPKMKYKGATVLPQRVKGKKQPKITPLVTEMSDEERQTLMERELEAQKLKQSLAEKEPEWQLFCDLWGNDLFTTAEYWKHKNSSNPLPKRNLNGNCSATCGAMTCSPLLSTGSTKTQAIPCRKGT